MNLAESDAAINRNFMVRDVPMSDRPRERILEAGANTLSNQELLAIVLRTGTSGFSVLNLAGRILQLAGGLRGLLEFDSTELMRIPGLGPAKTANVQASIELGRRISRMAPSVTHLISSPGDVAELMMDRMRFLQKEHFVVLHLDTKNRLIGEETASIGSLNASIVHPREIFRTALKRCAASIVCVHNHPSGDPAPSKEDRDVTKRLVEAGRILGIDVLDHVVIGDAKYTSFQEQGLM